MTALVRANAAGKSTLFRRIAGQMRGAGTVRFSDAATEDLRYMKSIALEMWLFAYELPETLLVLCKDRTVLT